MNIKRTISINGTDYTNKLLSVSDINVGVKNLGIGFISDIEVELYYDSNLLNIKGTEANVEIDVDGTKKTYTGIVRNIEYKENIITLNISHVLSVRKFTSAVFAYGNNQYLYTEVPIVDKVFRTLGTGITGKPAYIADTGTYDFSILNTNSYILYGEYIFDPGLALQDGRNIETALYRILNVSVDTNNKLVGDGVNFTVQTGNWGTAGAVAQFSNPASSNELLKVIAPTGGFSIYGLKKIDSSTVYSETDLSSDGIVDPNLYPEVKIVCNTDTSDIPYLYIYRNDEIDKENKENLPVFLQINNNISEPEDIIEDILTNQGFTVSSKRKPSTSKNINFNFRVKDNAKNLIEGIAKQGFVYVVPNLSNSFDIVSVGVADTDVLYQHELLLNSLKIEIEETEFDLLSVTYNKANLPGTDQILPEQKETFTYGTGSKLEEVEADLLVDSTSATNFASQLLDYESDKEFVYFEVPLISRFLDYEVGDVISFYSLNNTYNRFLQIIEKSIRYETIKFKAKKV